MLVHLAKISPRIRKARICHVTAREICQNSWLIFHWLAGCLFATLWGEAVTALNLSALAGRGRAAQRLICKRAFFLVCSFHSSSLVSFAKISIMYKTQYHLEKTYPGPIRSKKTNDSTLDIHHSNLKGVPLLYFLVPLLLVFMFIFLFMLFTMIYVP